APRDARAAAPPAVRSAPRGAWAPPWKAASVAASPGARGRQAAQKPPATSEDAVAAATPPGPAQGASAATAQRPPQEGARASRTAGAAASCAPTRQARADAAQGPESPYRESAASASPPRRVAAP